MSLGFGKVLPQDYEKLKAGLSGAQVPPAEYIGRMVEVTHIQPRASKKGGDIGAYMVHLLLTDDNVEEHRGKTVVKRFQYDPSPKTEGRTKMNEITEQGMAQFIDACGAEPMLDSNGAIDLVRTIENLPSMEPLVKFTVTHSEGYQELGGWTPVS